MNTKPWILMGFLTLFLVSCEDKEEETPQEDIDTSRSVSATINSTIPEEEADIQAFLMRDGYLLELKVDGQADQELENAMEIGESYSVDFDLDGAASLVFRHPDQNQNISPYYFYNDSIAVSASATSGRLTGRNTDWAVVQVQSEDESVTSIKIDGQDLFMGEEILYYAAVRIGEVSTLEIYRGEEIETYDLSEIEIGDVFEMEIIPEVTIDYIEIENEAFSQAIMSQVDTDEDGGISLEEAEAVTVLSIDGVELNVLNDLDNFTNLQELTINGAVLTAIDLSQNAALTFLDLNDNELESIDVSALVNLQILYLEDNYISSIDMSSLTNIQEVVLADNSFEEVFTLDGLNTLEYIDLSENLITGITFSNLPELQYLLLNETDIEELDLTDFPQITYLMLNYTPLTNVDVSMLTSLNYFECDNSSITCVQVSESRYNNPPSTWVLPSNAILSTNCSVDDVSAIEFDNDNLKAFLVQRYDDNDDGEISSQEAAEPTELFYPTSGISGSFQGLEYFVNLERLDTRNALYTNIDLTNLTKLEILEFRVGDTELDLSQNTALNEINIALEQETAITVVAENTIDKVILKSNRETDGYDLRPFKNATYIEVYGWEMKQVNLSGLSNLEFLDITSTNPNNRPTVSDFVADFSDLTSLQGLTLNFMRMDEIKGLGLLTELDAFTTVGATFNAVDFSNNTLLTYLDLRSDFTELRFAANMEFLREISYTAYDENLPTAIYIPENPNIQEVNLNAVSYLEMGEMVGLEEFSIDGFYNYDTEQVIYNDLELDLSASTGLKDLDIETVGISNVILPSDSSLEFFTLSISNAISFPIENFEKQDKLKLISFAFNYSAFTMPSGLNSLTNVSFSGGELKRLNLSSLSAMSLLTLTGVPRLECLTLPSGFDYTPPNGEDYTSGCN